MKQKRMVTMILTAAMVLSLAACGGTQESPNHTDDAASKQITDFVDWILAANESTTFLMVHTQLSRDLRLMGNIYSSLVARDNHSNYIPNVAKEWSHDETSETWTFKLRDDVTWVDVNGEYKGDCTAWDWATSMEWILNYHKNGAENTSMLIELITGAGEYYEYTKTLTEEEGRATKGSDEKFLDTVGIEIPDDYTIIYHLAKPAPYFHTVAVGACMCPLPQGQIDELGVDGTLAQTNENMWYNGPYTITEFIKGNSKVLKPNPAYFDKDCTLFDSVTILVAEDNNRVNELFMNGEVDRCEVTAANLRTIWGNESDPWHDYLVQTRPTYTNYQLVFNFGKRDANGEMDEQWNKAAANEAFRQSIYYGLDLKEYWAAFDFINPESNWTETFMTRELVNFSDGTDYVDRLMEVLGFVDGPRQNDELAQQYVEQAKQELSAQGVTFPVKMEFYIKSGDQVELDNATVLGQTIESIAEDYIDFEIKTYMTSLSQEVRTPGVASVLVERWGADYSDPENFLNQLVTGSDSAIYSILLNKANDITDPELKGVFNEFSQMVAEANAITGDTDERYEAQVQAEAFYYSHALMVPLRGNSLWSMTKENSYARPNTYTYKSWETSTEPYTTEQYIQIKNDFDAGKI